MPAPQIKKYGDDFLWFWRWVSRMRVAAVSRETYFMGPYGSTWVCHALGKQSALPFLHLKRGFIARREAIRHFRIRSDGSTLVAYSWIGDGFDDSRSLVLVELFEGSAPFFDA